MRRAARALVAALAALLPATGGADELPALSLQGYTGLLDVPDAEVLTDGDFAAAWSNQRDPRWRALGGSDSWFVTLGLLPFVEVGGRVQHGPELVHTRTLSDLSVHAKAQVPLRLLDPRLPALAIGAQDFAGAKARFKTAYVVATQALWIARATVGWGSGPDRLDGLFAGLELRPLRFLTLLAEHDGLETNLGGRLGIAGRVGGLRLGAALTLKTYLGGYPQRLELGVAVQAPLGRDPGRTAPAAGGPVVPPVAPVTSRPDEPPDPMAPLAAIRTALVRAGFEGVRVGVKARRAVWVRLENNRFNHDELDAIGVALGVVAHRAPPALDWIVLVLERRGLGQREVWAPARAVREFYASAAAREALAAEIEVDHFLSPLDDVVQLGEPPGDPSAWKAQLTLAPGLLSYVAWDDLGAGPLDVIVSARPEITVNLWTGAALNARWDIPFYWTDAFDDGRPLRDEREGPTTQHALLYQAVPLAPGLHALVGAGLLLRNTGGALGEVMWVSPDSMHQLRARGGHFRDRWDKQFTSALGSYRVWVPWLDLSVEATGGQYLFGDRGFSVELGRFFGATQINVFYLHTEAQLAGIRLTLPLTPRRDMRPYRVQVRGAPRWHHELATTVGQAENAFYPQLGIAPETDYTLDSVYYNAGRLGTVYLRRHLERLRDAWLRYGER